MADAGALQRAHITPTTSGKENFYMLNNTLIMSIATIISIEICLLILLGVASLIIWIKKKKNKKSC